MGATLPKNRRSSSARFTQHARLKVAAAKSDSRLEDAEKFLLPTYKRQPFLLERGKGCYVYDVAGKKYLDFSRRDCGQCLNAARIHELLR